MKHRNNQDKTTFKVRCAKEYAFYMFVGAKSQADAERKARIEMESKCDDDWYSEATHFNEAYEAEEAE